MGSSISLKVHNPTVDAHIEPAAYARRPRTLDGMVLGLLANRKRNADKLLEAIGNVLMEKYGLKGVVARSKSSSSKPCSPDLGDELAGQCDLIVTGVGDCGSCSSYTAHDAIGLEARGTPTVVLVTEPLLSVAEMMAEVGGIPDYPFVVLPHPLGSLSCEELRERAEKAIPEIIDALTA